MASSHKSRNRSPDKSETDKALAKLGLRRNNPVGKKMPPHKYYSHRMYESEIVPADLLANARSVLQAERPDFDYNVIKYDADEGAVTFIISRDFDTREEPIQDETFLVRSDGTWKFAARPADPLLYHHKWAFVKDDYPGFDVQSAKERTLLTHPHIHGSTEQGNKGKLSKWTEYSERWGGTL